MPKYLSSLAMCLALFSGTAVQAEEPVTIKFSHVVTDDTPKGQGALMFKKLVEERLAGKVKVEIYPNSTLYGDADEMQALKDGKVQMLAPSLSKLTDYSKQLQVFDLPFLFQDLAAVQRFMKREKSRELLRSMVKSNIYGIAFWNNGMKELSATKPLHLPAEAKGLAFRIQPSPVLESQFQAVGATAVKLPFAETFKALQSGKVQGTENPWSNFVGQKMDTVQPYVTESNHGSLNYMLITTNSFWTSLPFPVRSELESIIEEVTASVNKAANDVNQKARAQVQTGGKSTIIQLSPAEQDAWRQAMQPVWKQYETEIGPDVIRAAQVVNRR